MSRRIPVVEVASADDGGAVNKVITEKEIWSSLSRVTDPEMPVSIVDMGMVYGVRVNDGAVEIDMTFTAIGCPAIDMMIEDINAALMPQSGVRSVKVNVVWNPPWTKNRLTAQGKDILHSYGVSI
jgi:phenylacetate-CoA oxygenase PaaJ subunit